MADVQSEGPESQATYESIVHVLCFSFNQDYSRFVCGTTEGFRVYTSSPVRENRRRQVTDRPRSGDARTQSSIKTVGLVRMLFMTDIFPMVTIPTDDSIPTACNKIQIWDDAREQVIHVLRSKHEVKGIAVCRDVVAMVCEFKTYIYRADKLTILLVLTTAQNKQGLCDLAAGGNPWVLVSPGQAVGSIRVQVGHDDREPCIFQAHKGALAALSLNSSGTLIASASDYGTVVKVSSQKGELIHSLRRGMWSACVTSLAFRADDRFLAVASSSNTVHIFGIHGEHSRAGGVDQEEVLDRQTGAPSSGTSPSAGYLGAMSGYLAEPKALALFRIPDTDGGRPHQDVRSANSSIQGPQVGFHGSEPILLVLHYNGVLYEVNFKENIEDGDKQQECSYHSATTWFGVRNDFKVINPTLQVPTEEFLPGGDNTDEQDDEAWQVL